MQYLPCLGMLQSRLQQLQQLSPRSSLGAFLYIEDEDWKVCILCDILL